MTCRLIHIPPKPTKLGSCDLLLHGHTHVPREEMIAGVRALNPSTIGKANKGAPPSDAWLELEDGKDPKWHIMLL